MPDGLFIAFQRDFLPLSEHLEERYGQPAKQMLRELGRDELTDPQIAAIIDRLRVDPPTIGGADPAVRAGEGFRRPSGPGATVPTARFSVAFEVFGEYELLRHWPDRTAPDFPTLDGWYSGDDQWDWSLTDARPQHNLDLERREFEFRCAHERWLLGERHRGGPIALWTWVDLTSDEELQVGAGKLDPRAEVERNLAAITPIIEAIGRQVRQFFDDELPSQLRATADRLVAELDARQAVLANLTWPEGWKLPAPALAPEAAEEPAAAGTSGEPGEVVLPPSRRLSDASFGDVQQTIRVWANAVERYPETFARLEEDRLSDLLAATLNAALPGAHREVYNRAGKSDILVQGDAIDRAAGPENVFICESKVWRGAEAIDRALTQLEGYLQVRDTAACLVIFFKNKGHAANRKTALERLRSNTAYVRDSEALVSGWPVLDFRLRRRNVKLCVAAIGIPSTRAAAPQR